MRDDERILRSVFDDGAPPPPPEPKPDDRGDGPGTGPSVLLECAVLSLALTAYFVGKLAVWTVMYAATVVLHVVSGRTGDISSRGADLVESFAVGALVTWLLYRELARRLGLRQP